MKKEKTEGTPRVHLGIAVGITVIIALPFAFFLGKWNFATWIAFIVWAEYFAFGAKAESARLIFPGIIYGAFTGALWCWAQVFLQGFLSDIMSSQNAAVWLSYTVTAIPFMFILCFFMEKSSLLSEGSLAVFNGLTLFLASYFTGTWPAVGAVENPYWAVFMSFVWVVIMGAFGWFLGWINIVLTFPAKKPKSAAEEGGKNETESV